ncbi:ferritin-like domain-containing protein [Silvibacterium acidisoli]|uniref:ferritin-like domain-containing protein n=1 Tax=Acidobacteriaceae bacterium ZG23-2 TaxID=2883246 RepID=UPI00406C7CB8
MATAETQQLDEIIVSSRRRLLTLGGTALAGLAVAGATKAFAQSTVTDADILNFALNLEYLEAQFYSYATTGAGIDANGGVITSGSGTAGGTVTIKSNAKVPFTNPTIMSYAMEVAAEEAKHVKFLQTALGSASVAMPNIDLMNSFNGLASYAGLGSSFDPFASDVNFLLGSFIFEDVGVTAYQGAAPLLMNATYLDAAAGIMATEAYHAGMIRTTLYGLDAATPSAGINKTASAIAAARAKLDGTGNDDIGLGTVNVTLNGAASGMASTLVDADSNSMTFSRSTTQVLAIVYAGGTGKGGFYPAGMNGTIK